VCIFVEPQEVLSCFAENPSCKGKSVNRFRQWILKEAKLEVKLNICPRVNYNNLKVSVGNTGKINGRAPYGLTKSKRFGYHLITYIFFSFLPFSCPSLP